MRIPESLENAARRQFLRGALEIAGAALLLTTASRKILAAKFNLSSREQDEARHARSAQGARNPAALPVRSSDPRAGCVDCSGGCSVSCTGCAGGCAGTCLSGCWGTCTTSCSGTCTGTCTGTCAGGCAVGCTGGNS